ncbi:hypothetical protein N5079_33535 [Planotetraspora sp. A-T 1434]|uniref:hypothetical protein n=1 Tax=Planotetraspora sp. A-T 1434 TaxID=2979219 RepID=UPI0021C1E0E7|nr:hypothetical protein [Planotetraspora sp. A-T 1434]MCT9935136.1 hypothetical protein [Planotetraspora sp. A-T 1434]
MRDAGFFVLLGPDGAGKTTVMREIARRLPSVRLVSTDADLVPSEHALIARLRHSVVDEVLPGLGHTYSPEFLASLLQTAVVYLRDQAMAAGQAGPVVVDSYYYKILAKCRLAGIEGTPMYDWWRSFPQPDRVIYLDVTPESAWRRSHSGRSLNPMEYYGPAPERAGFELYQRNLRKLMLEEVERLPVTFVEEQARTADAVLRALAW